MSTVAPERIQELRDEARDEHDRTWAVVLWNDPVNLDTYVTYVLQKVLGLPKIEAERLMRQAHVEGKAVVSGGTREKAEQEVALLHGYGLWATLQSG